MISIHAPARGATKFENKTPEKITFQSTLPRGERPEALLVSKRERFGNFNPRSREGSDHYSPVFHHSERHFNPRSREGSDRGCYINPATYAISIHAPARGATHSWQMKLERWTNFNPRSREGSDNTINRTADTILDFNPRSREGSDKTAWVVI